MKASGSMRGKMLAGNTVIKVQMLGVSVVHWPELAASMASWAVSDTRPANVAVVK